MEDIAARRAAETLLAEHTANSTFKPLGPKIGPATIADAYDIQERYVPLLRDTHGEAVGYKVGLTSAAMQTFCGIGHPIAGVVLASRVHRSGASVVSNPMSRPPVRPVPPRRSRLTSAAFAPPLSWWTIAAQIMPTSTC